MLLGSRTMAPTDGEPSPYVLKEVFQVPWQPHYGKNQSLEVRWLSEYPDGLLYSLPLEGLEFNKLRVR